MKTPVVFIHGLWLHYSSWQDWEKKFAEAGFETISLPWPGEPATVKESRTNPKTMAGFGINEITKHFADLILKLPTKPILVGHSFGGLFVQKLLGMNLVKAGVAIDAAPIKGVFSLPLSALKVAGAVLKNPFNYNKSVGLTKQQFHFGFTNTLSDQESEQLYNMWSMPSPGRLIFQAAVANFIINSSAKVSVNNHSRGPLLLIAGGKDNTVPKSITLSTLGLYKKSKAITDYKEFPLKDHSLCLNSQNEEVINFVLGWIKNQNIV